MRHIKESDLIEVFEIQAEEISFDNNFFIEIPIIYQNDDFLIIDKPANVVCECNQRSNKIKNFTIIDFAKKFWQEKEGIENRYGLVHRLDKETSGLMIITKNRNSYDFFKEQFQMKTIVKEYIACIEKGYIEKKGKININIIRNPLCPITMSVSFGQGKNAITEYEVLQRTDLCQVVKCFPRTGRTHQIRVHFKYLGFSLIGDKIYGQRSEYIDRHALHAHKLSFFFKNTPYEFISMIPYDIKMLIEKKI